MPKRKPYSVANIVEKPSDTTKEKKKKEASHPGLI